jgi:hypothetical protein
MLRVQNSEKCACVVSKQERREINKARKKQRQKERKIESAYVRTMLLDCLVLPTGSKWRDFLRRVWNTLPSSVATRSVSAGASCDKSVLLISIWSHEVLEEWHWMDEQWGDRETKRERRKSEKRWKEIEREYWQTIVQTSSNCLLFTHRRINVNTAHLNKFFYFANVCPYVPQDRAFSCTH